LVLGFGSNQDLLRSPGGILVLGSGFWFEPRFAQESLGESWSLVLGFGSNQDLLRSPGGILVLGAWFWFEPRFAQESWGNLGPWFLVLVRTKICSGVLVESWSLVLGFGSNQDFSGVLGDLGPWFLVLGSNQDLLRSPGGILVLGSWFWFEPRFAQESWGNLGSWFLVLVRTKICSGVLGGSWSLVLGFGSNQDLLRSPGGILVLGFGSNQDLLRSPGGILVLGSWFWFEPRFAQESWGNLGPWFLVLVRTKICSGSWFWFEPRFAQESWWNLGPWFLVLVRTKICSGVLVESWSLVPGFGSNQDLLRSPGGILVLGSWF